MTDGLSEGDQQAVVFEPVTARQHGPQSGFGFFRGRGQHQAPSVRNPMDMGVNADARLAVRFGNYQIGGFPPHPFERQQVADFIRHPPVELIDQVAANLMYDARLGAIEPYRVDAILQLAW
jgi:hypothetical protein